MNTNDHEDISNNPMKFRENKLLLPTPYIGNLFSMQAEEEDPLDEMYIVHLRSNLSPKNSRSNNPYPEDT